MRSIFNALVDRASGKKSNPLARYARRHGKVPLSWAGSTSTMDYLNVGDALSAVMVALLSGRDIERIPSQSQSLRMACVGTIGHGFAGGEVWFWGTGASLWENPSAPVEDRRLFSVAGEKGFHVAATRGPYSEQLLTGRPEGSVGVYGDPVWLLPRFYNPAPVKKWKLGVIVHLSELSDRDPEPHIRPELLRYGIPEHLRGDIHLINTVTPIGMDPIKGKIDEILACERIVSTSLHGMVFAESYGIPCLHFPVHGPQNGLHSRDLGEGCDLDTRVIDLYRGLGLSKLPVYTQAHREPTNWEDLMAAIDRAWVEKAFDAEKLINAFPLDLEPLQAPQGKTIWDHPVLQALVLQHDVNELRRLDKLRAG
ncbi:polysaccharide pyruvyl transferase family protein [Pararhizobium qamdonense]|uniref:polysaccharide pyruvyl transferase family protein n=1 Tax=Pararhizobium qamdonense TaxID=3031126 RepID=UPI0023E2824B|nr:polysaccharide pyruvyl transferase family protein [Pararhizobium qamdonense]